MKREEVKAQHKWKLEDIFATDADWDSAFAALGKRIKEIEAFRGKLGDVGQVVKLFALQAELSLTLERLYTYCHMRRDEQTADRKSNEQCQKVVMLASKYSASASYIGPELSALSDEVLESYATNPALADYDYDIRGIIKSKKHILSPAEERLMSLVSPVLGSFREIFNVIDNVEMPFPVVKIDGEKVQFGHGKYAEMLQSHDRNVRRLGFKSMYDALGKIKHTVAQNYISHVKANNFRALARNHASALEASLSSDDVPKAVYEQLLAGVGRGVRSIHEYMEYRRVKMGLPKLHMYDLHCAISQGVELSLDYEQAYDLVEEGLAPLGPRYVELLRKGRNEGWIDVCETENKRSGAYHWGPYGTHPFVLLNYKKTTHDIFTIAHEMGHALHSYHSYSTQPYPKAHYSIFVAEVASTVNEMLLIRHLMKKTNDPAFREYLNQYLLDTCRTTIFRQTMFSEFEHNAHTLQQAGQPLTFDSLSEMYLKLNKKYYGTKSLSHDKQIAYEWARIPHFYTSYYVYKYSTGLTSAFALCDKILKGDTESYFRFLSAGGSKSPYEIMVDAGVDLATPAPYDTANAEIARIVASLTESIK